MYFFCFNPPKTEMFKKQEDRFLLNVTKAEEIQKSVSTELHEWSKNIRNVENGQFL